LGGPLGQLTRLWYDSPVDSIGGVNAELRWGYDQRGRLKADTSYTGATARATTYAYDTYERGSTLTDALGTWTTRYETNRGIADTLLTPMGDTVTYVFDGRGRANGPYLRGGGPLHSRVPVWTALAGALSTLTDTVATPTGFTPLKYDRNWVVDDPQPAGVDRAARGVPCRQPEGLAALRRLEPGHRDGELPQRRGDRAGHFRLRSRW
jgi:hypothetical protein